MTPDEMTPKEGVDLLLSIVLGTPDNPEQAKKSCSHLFPAFSPVGYYGSDGYVPCCMCGIEYTTWLESTSNEEQL